MASELAFRHWQSFKGAAMLPQQTLQHDVQGRASADKYQHGRQGQDFRAVSCDRKSQLLKRDIRVGAIEQEVCCRRTCLRAQRRVLCCFLFCRPRMKVICLLENDEKAA